MPSSRLIARGVILCAFAAALLVQTAKADSGPALTASRADSKALDLDDLNSDQSELRGVIDRYRADRGSVQRSSSAGTPTRDARMKEFYERWLGQLRDVDFDPLTHDGQVDYVLFKNHLDHELRLLDLRAQQQAEIASLVPFAQPIFDLEDSRRRLEQSDWSKVAGTLARLKGQIADARRQVEAGHKSESAPTKTVANRAAGMVDSLRGILRNWHGFYNGYDPGFTWWMEAPHKAVDQSLQDYARFLRQRFVGATVGSTTGPPAPDAAGRSRRRSGDGGDETASDDTASPAGAASESGSDIIGNPIGRDALLSELKHEMIPYTAEELIAIAEREFAWCEVQMKKAAAQLGFGDEWKAALEHVKNQYVEPGKQPELIRQLAVEAIEYLDKHDLVTVPPLCRESWRIAMMSPERQLVNPFFTGGETISVSFPTNTMSHEAKLMSLRGNNRHFARATVHHEVIPGHHLQGFMTSRYRNYRGPFGTAFWTEGWALYWELLLWDMDFAQSPEDRVGMLFWRMHRCARIIFSLSFHLERMTPQECIDFLVDRVGHERDNAIAEVRRSFASSYGPLYQAAYLLGGLQFRALNRELVQSGKMTSRAFHDRILKENGIPVEMVRAILTKQPLGRDFQTSWKFYESLAEEGRGEAAN
jgi:uncharacterized protein (DUF885 family)